MDLFHWERFEPNLGDNHQLPRDQRLFFEIACGMTKVQLKACQRGMDVSGVVLDQEAAKLEAERTKEPLEDVVQRMATRFAAERVAEIWGPYVRLGNGNHTLNGVKITSLIDYLTVVIEQQGKFNLLELGQVIRQLNSVDGSRALFFERLSGGPTFTAEQRTDAEENATASR